MSDTDITGLYSAHRRELVSYANGIVGDAGRAEDIAQDAYLRFRTAMTEEWRVNPVSYLYRIVRNLALDARRRSLFERTLFPCDLDSLDTMVPPEAASPEEHCMIRRELEQLRTALDELPERTRKALEMHRLGGYKLREIAQRLEVSPSMAQYLVKEGIKHCQRRLADGGFAE